MKAHMYPENPSFIKSSAEKNFLLDLSSLLVIIILFIVYHGYLMQLVK